VYTTSQDVRCQESTERTNVNPLPSDASADADRLVSLARRDRKAKSVHILEQTSQFSAHLGQTVLHNAQLKDTKIYC